MVSSNSSSNEPILCLRWMDKNNPSSELNLPEAFRDLRQNQDFFDVTLGCTNNSTSSSLQAHKVILSAYSNVFKEILRSHKNQSDPFIFLKGVSYEELSFLLDFMYEGEVNVNQSQLSSFLAVAKELQVKGLIAKDIEEDDEDEPDTKRAKKPSQQDLIQKAIEKKLATQRSSTKTKKKNFDLENDEMEQLQKYVDSSVNENIKHVQKRSRVLPLNNKSSKIIRANKNVVSSLSTRKISKKHNRFSDEDIVVVRSQELGTQQFAEDHFIEYNTNDGNFLISGLSS